MPPTAENDFSLTPHGALEGWQDTANPLFVAGWAWNRDTPNVPVTVAIYDNGVVLGTAVADRYRKDLRQAGIGDGHHAFIYALAGRLRHRNPLRRQHLHHVTVRIAATDATLRDVRTGGVPGPVIPGDGPAPIPHFSMPPVRRWAYFTVLRRALAVFPRPVWRPLAVALGGVHMVLDRQSRVLNRALLDALRVRPSWGARLRLHWARAYQRQADLILLVQGERLTREWAVGQVRWAGSLPPGGAVLVSVHHHAQRLVNLTLAARGYHLGVITANPRDPQALIQADPTLQTHWRLSKPSTIRSFGARRFSPHEAGRKGLRLLRDGGYLMLNGDEFARRPPFSPLLGRSMTVPRGAVWFAQQSGKPLIPYMAVPEGLHWRLWVGEAVPPTQQGLCDALEECIRHAPGSWQRFMAMAWLAAPHADTPEP